SHDGIETDRSSGEGRLVARLGRYPGNHRKEVLTKTFSLGEGLMWKIAIGLVIGALLAAPDAKAQFARQEVLAFESAMMPVEDFLPGKKGTPVTLAGYLRLPKANEKNPVVVIFHGAGGLGPDNGVLNEWARVLNEAGIATFTVDGFSGRGV